MSLIYKSEYKDLIFLVPSERTISKILKIIILINLIDDTIKITKYLQSKLFN